MLKPSHVLILVPENPRPPLAPGPSTHRRRARRVPQRFLRAASSPSRRSLRFRVNPRRSRRPHAFTLGMAHVPLPFVEHGILASVLIFGLLTAFAARVPLAASMASVGLFELSTAMRTARRCQNRRQDFVPALASPRDGALARSGPEDPPCRADARGALRRWCNYSRGARLCFR